MDGDEFLKDFFKNLFVSVVSLMPLTACLCCPYFSDRYVYRRIMPWLAVWLSGNALASINVVALRQTRLVLGWVTVCGRVNHLGM